jgi:SAM-dependent methyltransferase
MANALSPILRAFAAQAVVLIALVLLRLVVKLQTPILPWVFAQALGSAWLGRRWSLGPYWMLFQMVLPLVVFLQSGHHVPIWAYPTLLTILFLVYGGGLFTRVPLYNSRRSAWKVIADLVPDQDATFIDLGAGLGGPLSFIAKRRPRARLLGVEASPLVWLVGWLRTVRFGRRCSFRLGSIWNADLREASVVFALLSPAPMPELWAKAKREMQPGSLLISHTFEVPGRAPDTQIPIPGRKGAALLLYRMD